MGFNMDSGKYRYIDCYVNRSRSTGIRVRAVPGLVAADYFAPCYFAWAFLIENLAKIGYEGKNLHMASYDWRLSFHNTEVCSD
ncbi:putative transferase [Arabidopsis thaliana]